MPDSGGQHGLTRRTLLGGLAGAGVAGLLRPSAGIAAVLGRGSSVFSSSVGPVAGSSRELAAPRRFVLAAVEWAGPRSARIELRARVRGGGWSRWGVASTLGHGPDGPQPDAPLIGEAIWTGPADYLQLRSSCPLPGVRLHFVSLRVPNPTAATAAALPLARPVLDAGPGQPPIIARLAWGGGHAPPAVTPGYGTVKMAFVHHTDSLNGYGPGDVPAMLLAIYDFHRYTRGWNDIGYNFMIDLFGRIWEARAGGIDQAVIGAQAGGYNLESTGVAVLGTFMDVVPSAAATTALKRLLAWKLSLHGVPTLGNVTVKVDPAAYFYTPFKPGAHVSLPRVAGHRQGDTTDCPGDAFFARLPSIRPHVAALAGTPARVTLRPPAKAPTAAAPVAVSGRLTHHDGVPMAGAPVEVRALHASIKSRVETTLQTATTGLDGRWSASVTLTENAFLRALHRPRPATVSDLVEIAIAPGITVTVESVSPLKVSVRIHPAKRNATIDLYAVKDGRSALLHRKQVAVRHGSFAAKLATRGPGQYRIAVNTAADALSAAGTSTPVKVTVP